MIVVMMMRMRMRLRTTYDGHEEFQMNAVESVEPTTS